MFHTGAHLSLGSLRSPLRKFCPSACFRKGSRGGTWNVPCDTWRHVTHTIVVPALWRIEWAWSRPDLTIRSAAIDESAPPALTLRPAGTESVVAPPVAKFVPNVTHYRHVLPLCSNTSDTALTPDLKAAATDNRPNEHRSSDGIVVLTSSRTSSVHLPAGFSPQVATDISLKPSKPSVESSFRRGRRIVTVVPGNGVGYALRSVARRKRDCATLVRCVQATFSAVDKTSDVTVLKSTYT